jgi:hypothetical protein
MQYPFHVKELLVKVTLPHYVCFLLTYVHEDLSPSVSLQDAFVKIARSEGPLSLWSGLSPTLVLAVPATVVYFVTYENLRLLVKDRHGGIQPYWGPLIAGAAARFWAVTLVSPLELIRTKMQSKKVSYQGKPL